MAHKPTHYATVLTASSVRLSALGLRRDPHGSVKQTSCGLWKVRMT